MNDNSITPSAIPQPPINPLIAKLRVPPEIQRLPSGGNFYDETILVNVNGGEVHVHPLTALDELEIKSPDLLFNGEAISNVIRRCVPEIKQPSELFVKDVDFIMLALRKATYGAHIEVKYKHEDDSCADAKEHSYMVDLNALIRSARELDPVSFNKQRQCKIGNDQSQYIVTLTPMRLKHMVQMMQSIDTNLTDLQRRQRLLSALALLINDVDGITDQQQIFEFLQTVPTTWIQQISETAEKISSFGPTFIQKHICKDCGQEVDIHVNVNPLTFFTM